MKCVFFENNSLKLGQAARPVPKEGEILLKVKAIGINRADILQMQGLYPAPDGSNIPGLEVAGIREDSGERVCALLDSGGYAEYVCADERRLINIPDNIDFIQAAALPEALVTIWLNLYQLGRLRAGKDVLIHGGTSGIGTLAVQFACVEGGKVYTTARGIERLKGHAVFNECHLLSYQEEFGSIIKGSGGVDLILDILGGEYLAQNLKALKKYGQLVSIAVMNSSKAEINLGAVLMKNLIIVGSTLRGKSLQEKIELIEQAKEKLLPYIIAGKVEPVIDSSFSLYEVEKAYERLQSRQHIGKVLLLNP